MTEGCGGQRPPFTMDPRVEGTWEPNSLGWVDPHVLPLGDICQVAAQQNPAVALGAIALTL